MKIEVQGPSRVAFSTLSNAEVFKTKRGNYFMKITPTQSKETDEIYTAVDLNLGVSYAIDDDEIVTKVNATLTVTEA